MRKISAGGPTSPTPYTPNPEITVEKENIEPGAGPHTCDPSTLGG